METKHTAGNWLAKDGQIYSEQTGQTLAVIPYFKSDEVQEANSKLMAAAPDLYMWLSHLHDELKQGRYISDFELREVEQILRNANNL